MRPGLFTSGIDQREAATAVSCKDKDRGTGFYRNKLIGTGKGRYIDLSESGPRQGLKKEKI